MDDTLRPDPHQNPYHPFEETERYRAFQEGWAAREGGQPRTALPYPLSRADRALAWLDGWTAVEQRSGDPALDGLESVDSGS